MRMTKDQYFKVEGDNFKRWKELHPNIVACGPATKEVVENGDGDDLHVVIICDNSYAVEYEPPKNKTEYFLPETKEVFPVDHWFEVTPERAKEFVERFPGMKWANRDVVTIERLSEKKAVRLDRDGKIYSCSVEWYRQEKYTEFTGFHCDKKPAWVDEFKTGDSVCIKVTKENRQYLEKHIGDMRWPDRIPFPKWQPSVLNFQGYYYLCSTLPGEVFWRSHLNGYNEISTGTSPQELVDKSSESVSKLVSAIENKIEDSDPANAANKAPVVDHIKNTVDGVPMDQIVADPEGMISETIPPGWRELGPNEKGSRPDCDIYYNCWGQWSKSHASLNSAVRYIVPASYVSKSKPVDTPSCTTHGGNGGTLTIGSSAGNEIAKAMSPIDFTPYASVSFGKALQPVAAGQLVFSTGEKKMTEDQIVKLIEAKLGTKSSPGITKRCLSATGRGVLTVGKTLVLEPWKKYAMPSLQFASFVAMLGAAIWGSIAAYKNRDKIDLPFVDIVSQAPASTSDK